jgi:hypothetical protein
LFDLFKKTLFFFGETMKVAPDVLIVRLHRFVPYFVFCFVFVVGGGVHSDPHPLMCSIGLAELLRTLLRSFGIGTSPMGLMTTGAHNVNPSPWTNLLGPMTTCVKLVNM